MNDTSRTPRRSYDNTLREQQAAQTRDRILDAVARQIWEGNLEDFSVAKVAERSGVSAPTIYRHFPNRTALLDAVNEWLGKELERPPFATDAAAMMERVGELFAYYERQRERLRMARVTEAMREVREQGRKERDRAMAALLGPLTEHLSPDEANAIVALFRVLYGFDAYELMTDRFGVSRDDAAAGVRWAMQTLTTALERDRDAKRRRKGGRRSRGEGDR